MDWFLNSTDAPHVFGEAAGLMCLSSIALKHRWLEGADKLNSNIYMMIVGPSSRARKSTTVKRAREVLEKVWPARVGPTDYTAEGLFKWMNEKDPKTNEDHTALTLFASEFTADLARSAGYKNSFRDDLTNIYDGFDVIKIRSGVGKSINVPSPRVSVMAAIAYDGLVRNVTNNDWGSGFLMRFLYLAPVEYRQLLVRPAPKDHRRKQLAVDALGSIADEIEDSAKGLGTTPAAWKMFENAFNAHHESIKRIEGESTQEDESLATTYMHRFWPNVRKLALLYQLDIDPHSDVDLEAMQSALNFAAYCWQSFETAHKKTTANDFGTLCREVLNKVGESGKAGFPAAELGELFGFTQQLSYVLLALKATDNIREELVRGRKLLFLR